MLKCLFLLCCASAVGCAGAADSDGDEGMTASDVTGAKIHPQKIWTNGRYVQSDVLAKPVGPAVVGYKTVIVEVEQFDRIHKFEGTVDSRGGFQVWMDHFSAMPGNRMKVTFAGGSGKRSCEFKYAVPKAFGSAYYLSELGCKLDETAAR